MAYCNQCGAYLADGFDKCPACGKSIRKSEKKKSGDDSWDIYEDNGFKGGAAAYHSSRVEKQRVYERYESEKTERQEQEFNTREWSYAESAHDAKSVYDVPDGSAKLFAALSYWDWLFLVPLIFDRKDPFVKLHLNQGLILFIISILSNLIGILGWIINIVVFIMRAVGCINAVRGNYTKLPLVGEIDILK